MKKLFLFLFILLLGVAYFTKPDDKTCIIEGVRAVWGNITPNPYHRPDLFEHFMDLNSKSVQVKDWIFFKQVKYKIGQDQKVVAYGAFKNVYPTVSPMERNGYIPKMPQQSQK